MKSNKRYALNFAAILGAKRISVAKTKNGVRSPNEVVFTSTNRSRSFVSKERMSASPRGRVTCPPSPVLNGSPSRSRRSSPVANLLPGRPVPSSRLGGRIEGPLLDRQSAPLGGCNGPKPADPNSSRFTRSADRSEPLAEIRRQRRHSENRVVPGFVVAARVKGVVASLMQPAAVYLTPPRKLQRRIRARD